MITKFIKISFYIARQYECLSGICIIKKKWIETKKKRKIQNNIWNIDYNDKINPKKTTYCLGILFFYLSYFILHIHTYIYIFINDFTKQYIE